MLFFFFVANILKFLHSSVNRTNTRQYLWPGPLFLLKRPATFNSAVVWAVSSKMQLSSSPDKHPQNISPFNSKPPTLHMLSLSYSFILHLSFSYAHWQMRFTLFTFFTLYPQHNQVSSSSICDNQLVQTEIKKHKSIKSITTPRPPNAYTAPLHGADLACKLQRSLKRHWGYCLEK